MILKVKCPICGKENTIIVDDDDYIKYMNGTFVQKAFSNLDASTREMIITGLCPSCQETIFNSDEE